MNSDEEYLDSLLQSVAGGGREDNGSPMTEEEIADIFSAAEKAAQEEKGQAAEENSGAYSGADSEDTPIDIDAMLSELTNGTFDLDAGENGPEDKTAGEKATPQEEVLRPEDSGELPEDGAREGSAVTVDDTQKMTEEEIESLLSASLAEGTEDGGPEPEEEPGFPEAAGDEDLEAITNLLQKSENNEVVDDDVLALLESVSGESASGGEPFDLFNEETEENAGEIGKKKSKREKRPKKERKNGRAKRKSEEAVTVEGQDQENAGETAPPAQASGNAAGQEDSAGPKKPGLLSRIFAMLTEEAEPSEEERSLNLTEENETIIKELDAEDRAAGKKKKKKAGKGQQKGKAQETQDEEKENGKSKGKKKKEKPPKAAKPQKVKKVKEETPEPAGRKLSVKSVAVIFVFAFSILACILISGMFLPELADRKNADRAFQEKNYMEVFGLLYGKNNGGQEERMLQHARAVLTIERRLESYAQLKEQGQALEALDSLMRAVGGYDKLYQYALNCGAEAEVAEGYARVLAILSEQYGLSEAQARAIAATESDADYTRYLSALAEGQKPGDISLPVLEEGVQDLLPEEMELPETNFTE